MIQCDVRVMDSADYRESARIMSGPDKWNVRRMKNWCQSLDHVALVASMNGAIVGVCLLKISVPVVRIYSLRANCALLDDSIEVSLRLLARAKKIMKQVSCVELVSLVEGCSARSMAMFSSAGFLLANEYVTSEGVEIAEFVFAHGPAHMGACILQRIMSGNAHTLQGVIDGE